MGKPISLVPAQLLSLVPRRLNFVWAMMQAVANDQSSMQTSQINGSFTTELAAKIEEAMYQFWNGILEDDATATEDAANSGKDPNGPGGVTVCQEKYQKDSAQAQAVEGQQDGSVQDSQQSVQAVASDLQMVAQQAQGVTSIMSALTQMLASIIG